MEARLFDPNDPPPWVDPRRTAEWHADREAAPHIDEGVHQPRMFAAIDFVCAHARKEDIIVDLGAGDGGMLQVIRDRLATPSNVYIGYDIMTANVHAAFARGVHVILRDVVNSPSDDWAAGDIVICTEMLEHLWDPHGFVRRIARRRPRLFVASSPVNETVESHYAHHTWAWDEEGYEALMTQAGFVVIDRWTNGQFQVVACA